MHTTYDVHDMAVALDGTVGLDVHATGTSDAPEVVAREVDEHDVLGVLLRIGAQLLLAGRHRPRDRRSGAAFRRSGATALVRLSTSPTPRARSPRP